MATIDIKLKTYDELTFEITRLNTDLYLKNIEINRLNNIIEELEKYLFSQLQEYGGGGMVQEYYDKLKELKERSDI